MRHRKGAYTFGRGSGGKGTMIRVLSKNIFSIIEKNK